MIAQEQSGREQFQAAVVAFQKSATEDNARKLAELSKRLDPPPAVPEDAEFRALKGAAFVKQASDAAAFARAAAEFNAAIALAPWIGEYHFNLAVCEKSAGHFPAALAALKLAQIFARDDQGRRDCLVLRAELEAAQELAAARKAEEAKAAAAKAAAKAAGPDFSGEWVIADEEPKGFSFYRINRSGNGWNVVNSGNGKSEGVFVAQGRQLAWKSDHLNISTHHLRLTLSEDGQSIEKAWLVTQSAAQRKASGFTLQDGSEIRTRLKRK